MSNLKVTIQALVIKYVPDLNQSEILTNGIMAQLNLILRKELMEKIMKDGQDFAFSLMTPEYLKEKGYIKKDGFYTSHNPDTVPKDV